MLSIFNRTIVYSTYDEKNLERVMQTFDKENITYLVRVTRSALHFDELGSAYQLYVRKEDVDIAQRMIHELFFSE